MKAVSERNRKIGLPNCSLVASYLAKLEDDAPLHRVGAVPLRKAGVIVADRRALLDEILPRVLSADADDSDVLLADQVRIERLGVPVGSLIRQRDFVEPVGRGDLPASQHGVDPLLDVLGRLETRLAAEATHVRLGAQGVAHVHVLPGPRLVGALRKEEVFPELGWECAFELAQVQARRKRRAAEKDLGVTVLPVLLVGAEDEQLVSRDRAADRDARLEPLVGRFREIPLFGVLVQ